MITKRNIKIRSKADQVRSLLFNSIEQGVYQHGEHLPSEAILAENFSVSRVTIRNAIRDLTRHGVLRSQPGIGHVICSTQAKPNIGLLFGHEFLDPQSVPFHGLLIEAVRAELIRRGYTTQFYMMQICGHNNTLDRERLMNHVKSGQLHGVLAMAWPCSKEKDPSVAKLDEELADMFQAKKLPCTGVADVGLPGSVGTDYHSIGYLGTWHFCSNGVDKVALLIPETPDHSQERALVGYRDAMNESGVPVNEQWICRTDGMTEQDGYIGFKRWWLSLDDKPRAVVMPDDVLAKGAMIGVIELDVRLTEQLQFACLAIRGSKMFFPLPFVRLWLDPAQYATEAVNRLVGIIDHPEEDVPPSIFLQPEVIDDKTSNWQHVDDRFQEFRHKRACVEMEKGEEV